MIKNPLPKWIRTLVVLLPAIIGVPLVFFDPGYIWRLFGIACLGIALYGLIPQLHPWLNGQIGQHEFKWLPNLLPPLVLCVIAAALFAPAFLGLMPQSQDHPVHLTRAWHFVTQMLAKARLSGWSDLWFAGWPAGEDYPPGGDFWISSLYLPTFGLLGWEATYALAFMAIYAFSAVSIYSIGKVYLGKTAGFLAGIFFLLDRGQYREGGWDYTVWWGVWPQMLATSYMLFSFALLDRVINRAKPKDFAFCSLVIGLAILTHPVSIIYYGIGVFVYLIVRALGNNERTGSVIVRTIGVFVLGFCLAAFWILPFSAKGAWMAKYGDLWKSIPDMANGLWQGTLFSNVTPPLIWLAVMGICLAAWKRNYAGIFFAIFAALTLFASSSTTFNELNLIGISKAFGQVQFQRLSIVAKVLFFLLAGYAIQTAFGSIVKQSFAWRRYILGCFLIIAIAPFIQPVLVQWVKHYGGSIGNPKTRKDLHNWSDYKEFLDWSNKLRQQEKDFYRIAYVRPYNDHFFAAAPVYNKTPAYKVGYTPCTNFIHKVDIADEDLYELLSIKYVVSIGAQHSPNLALEKRFGSINVYRFTKYSSKRYTLEGPGQAKVEQFDTEKIRVKLDNTTNQSRFYLHVANYPNWKAWINNEPVKIETGQLGKHKIFISMPVKNGLLEIRYTWPLINKIGALASFFVIVIFGLMILCRFRPAFAQKIKSRLLPIGYFAERFGIHIGIIVALIPLVAFAFKASTQNKEAGLKNSLVDQLKDARVEIVRDNVTIPCNWQRNKRWQCSDKSWNYVGLTSERIGDEFRQCIWAHPLDGSSLQIRFPNLHLGKALVGYHGLLDQAVQSFPNGADVKLEISLGDKITHAFVRPNIKGWEPWKIDTSSMNGQVVDLRLNISTINSGGRHYCFDIAMEK